LATEIAVREELIRVNLTAMDALKVEVYNLRTRNTAIEAQLISLQSQINLRETETLRLRVSELTTQINEYAAQIRGYESQVTSLNLQISTLTTAEKSQVTKAAY
jgi:chromosome segregation ATPase